MILRRALLLWTCFLPFVVFAQAGQSQTAADAVEAQGAATFPFSDKFGLLARLAGGYYWSDGNSNLLTFRWLVPGQHLVAEYRKPGLDAIGESHFLYDQKTNQVRMYILDMVATAAVHPSSLTFTSSEMSTLHINLLQDGSVDWNTDGTKGWFGVPATYNRYRRVPVGEVPGLLRIAQDKADEIEYQQRLERRKIWGAVFQATASVLSKSAEFYASQAEQSQAALQASIAEAQSIAQRANGNERNPLQGSSSPSGVVEDARTGNPVGLQHSDGGITESAPQWTGDPAPRKRETCKIPATTGEMFELKENLEREARRLCGSRYQGFVIRECGDLLAEWCHATYQCGEGTSENACPGASASAQ